MSEEKPLKKKPRISEEENVESGSNQPGFTHYYVKNFILILDDIEKRYESLFSEDEITFLTSWRELSYAAKQLYVRLFSRKVSIK